MVVVSKFGWTIHFLLSDSWSNSTHLKTNWLHGYTWFSYTKMCDILDDLNATDCYQSQLNSSTLLVEALFQCVRPGWKDMKRTRDFSFRSERKWQLRSFLWSENYEKLCQRMPKYAKMLHLISSNLCPGRRQTCGLCQRPSLTSNAWAKIAKAFLRWGIGKGWVSVYWNLRWLWIFCLRTDIWGLIRLLGHRSTISSRLLASSDASG
jgi:hypothetical protein